MNALREAAIARQIALKLPPVAKAALRDAFYGRGGWRAPKQLASLQRNGLQKPRSSLLTQLGLQVRQALFLAERPS